MPPSRHSDDEKLAILNEWLNSDPPKTAQEVADRHGLHEMTLRKWKRRFVASHDEAHEDPDAEIVRRRREPSGRLGARIPDRDWAMALRHVREAGCTTASVLEACERWGMSRGDLRARMGREGLEEVEPDEPPPEDTPEPPRGRPRPLPVAHARALADEDPDRREKLASLEREVADLRDLVIRQAARIERLQAVIDAR